MAELQQHPATWTCDNDKDVGPLYYFAPTNAGKPARGKTLEVGALLDVADDGTLAGVELAFGDLPPPPSTKPADCSAPEVDSRLWQSAPEAMVRKIATAIGWRHQEEVRGDEAAGFIGEWPEFWRMYEGEARDAWALMKEAIQPQLDAMAGEAGEVGVQAHYLERVVGKFREVLRVARDRFEEYAYGHTARGALDKAARNEDMVRLLDSALALKLPWERDELGGEQAVDGAHPDYDDEATKLGEG